MTLPYIQDMFKLLFALALALAFTGTDAGKHVISSRHANNCVVFQVAAGTGCQWMCSYCANTLGTNNYYFTDGVCTYGDSGCVGNPVAGASYTCCAV